MGAFSGLTGSRCAELEDYLSYINLVISILILLGIVVSYLPQHFRIISRGTSEGISPYFILLGTTSGTCAFANILVSPTSRADAACCKTLGYLECFAGLLGIAQVGAQWFCFAIILLLYLVFFPRDPTLHEPTTAKQGHWRTALAVALICLLHGLVTIIMSATLIYFYPNYLGIWANSLGIGATVLAGIQYFPQIWTTYHFRHVGSLSIPMMVIQTPGSFLWAGSLAARMGPEGWSTWGIFLVTGCLQGCLLGMGIYFEIEARRAQHEAENEYGSVEVHTEDTLQFQNGSIETDDEGAIVVENGHTSERTPLLDSSRKGLRP